VAEIARAEEGWQNRFRIPGIIEAIDCTRVTKPGIVGDEYINRKGYSSFNVQATSDADEKFTSVTAWICTP
jgi:hypothetical protein